MHAPTLLVDWVGEEEQGRGSYSPLLAKDVCLVLVVMACSDRGISDGRLNKTLKKCRGHLHVGKKWKRAGRGGKAHTDDVIIHVEEDAFVFLHEIELALPLSSPCLAHEVASNVCCALEAGCAAQNAESAKLDALSGGETKAGCSPQQWQQGL